MRNTIKGESNFICNLLALSDNIARFDSLRRMKITNLLKYTSKLSAKKISSEYQRVNLFVRNRVNCVVMSYCLRLRMRNLRLKLLILKALTIYYFAKVTKFTLSLVKMLHQKL